MQKKFLRNLAFLVLLNLLIKPFWIFGIDRTVQNMTGNPEYGLYFAVLNFSFLFHILLDSGIVNFNNRSIAQNDQLLESYLPNILGIKIILGFAYLAVTFVFALISGLGEHALYFLLLLTINQFLVSMILYLRSNISALQFFIADSILSVLDKFIMILICSALLWTSVLKTAFSIEYFIYAQTVALIITLLIVTIVVNSKAATPKLKFDWQFAKQLLGKTFPFALLGVLMSVYNRIDVVMIERLLGKEGDEEAGIYAQGFRLFDAANMFGFLFASLLLPMFARMLSEKKNIEPLLATSFKTILIFGCTLAAVSFFYRAPIMDMLYYRADQYSADIFGMLMISFIGICTMYVFGSLLTANASMKQLNRIALAGVILNISLNLVLIPQYKALGATIATLITQLIVAAAHILVARKIFSLKSNRQLIMNILLFVIAVLIITYSSTLLHTDWKFNFLIAACASVLTAFLLRLLQWKQMADFLKPAGEVES